MLKDYNAGTYDIKNKRQMIIPYDSLTTEALQALIEDFVTRDGTDYGEREASLTEKTAQVLLQLQNKELFISYDDETQTCGLLSKQELDR